MFCSKCGAEIPDGSQWCPQCGAQQGVAAGPTATPNPTFNPNVTPTPNPAYNVPAPSAPGAVPGFILSLAGLLLDWVPIAGFVLSIVGTAICGKGKKQMAANPMAYSNAGLLSAGHVIGIIGIVLGAFYLVFWLIWVVILGGGSLMLFDFIKDMAQLDNL